MFVVRWTGDVLLAGERAMVAREVTTSLAPTLGPREV